MQINNTLVHSQHIKLYVCLFIELESCVKRPDVWPGGHQNGASRCVIGGVFLRRYATQRNAPLWVNTRTKSLRPKSYVSFFGQFPFRPKPYHTLFGHFKILLKLFLNLIKNRIFKF